MVPASGYNNRGNKILAWPLRPQPKFRLKYCSFKYLFNFSGCIWKNYLTKDICHYNDANIS
jgi:hypothetical protein